MTLSRAFSIPYLIILTVTTVTIGLAGCFSQDQNESVAEPQWPVPPDEPPVSANDVVTSFVQAYNNRDIDLYRSLLHPDYYFSYRRHREQMPIDPVVETLDRETDLAITANIFSGEPMQHYLGVTVPGIEQIIWHTFTPAGVWVRTESWGIITIYKRLYTVRLEIITTSGQSLFLKGHHIFEAVRTQSSTEGSLQEIWQVYRLEDFIQCDGPDPACVTWAGLKLMYRE